MTSADRTSGRPVVASDLLRLRWPLEPAMRSDGRAVAYVVSGPSAQLDALAYDVVIDELDDSGRRVGATRRVDGCRAPNWSPGGATLACVQVIGEPGVVVVGSPGYEPRRVFAGPVIDFDWSPTGSHLAVLTTHDTVVLVAATGDDQRTFGAPEGSRLVRWAPGGVELALVGGTDGLDERPLVSTVTLVDVATEKRQVWLAWSGPVRNAAWSPTERVLAVVGHDRGPAGWEHDGVWLARGSDEPAIKLTGGHDLGFGRAVRGDDERALGLAPLQWCGDGTSVLTTVVDGGRSRIVRVGLDGVVTDVVAGERAALEVAAAASSTTLVFTWSDPSNPGELSALVEGVERPLTDINAAWLAEVALAPTVALNARDADDASAPEVDGWLTLPPEQPAEPAPLVVQVHGGPHLPVGWRFSFDAQRLAALGFAVLRGNPRGSTGRGREFARAIEGDWGGPDLRDVLALTEAAAGRAGVDGSRAAIVGESYGGFMASWAVVTSDRFAAAIAENAIFDPLQLALGPRGPSFWWVEFAASAHDEPGRYRARSSAARAADVAAPLLLIHAEDDDNVLIGQSELMHQALVARGLPVRFVTVPGEGHMVNVFGRPSRRLARTAAFDAFLFEHLHPDRRPTGVTP